MSLAQFDDFLDQKKGGGKYIVVFKDKKNHVIDGIEIKTFGQNGRSIQKTANEYANDLMAREGLAELSWEIQKK
jgi:hypothetical protein